MNRTVALALAVGLLAYCFWTVRRWLHHRVAAGRVPMLIDDAQIRILRVGGIEEPAETAFPWVLGIAAAICFVIIFGLGLLFAVAVGVLAWVVGGIIKETIIGRRILRLEGQLAEAIDHVITSLHAGIGVLDALSGAETDARKPLKPHLTTLVSRIRLGDDAIEVCRDMSRMLPLESFRLFYYALAIQWEGGGNLAPTLATVGRFIRDRVELGRRVRAQTSEARFSVLAVLLLTYFLALLMWNLDPTRVEGFMGTEIGRTVAAGAVILQALGALWVTRLSRIRI